VSDCSFLSEPFVTCLCFFVLLWFHFSWFVCGVLTMHSSRRRKEESWRELKSAERRPWCLTFCLLMIH
jgi:hypothetical protein